MHKWDLEKLKIVILVLACVARSGRGRWISASAQCKFPAIYNFGDTNSDTGGVSAAFGPIPSPYGETFFRRPAGRYSDGRLIIDFMAENLGLPYLSPYLDSLGRDFRHGANFAAGGSTIIIQNETIWESGISPFLLDVQTTQFDQFKLRTYDLYQQATDPLDKAKIPRPNEFSRALYTFDIGQNDLSAAARKLTGAQLQAVIPQIVNRFAAALTRLYQQGARAFWIHNVGPIGCMPVATLYIRNQKPGLLDKVGCINGLNNMVVEFNRQLKARVNNLRAELPHAALNYVDIYSAKYDLISNAKIYGFRDPMKICCGIHESNMDVWCGQRAMINDTEVFGGSCGTAETYISWDGVHFSEAANHWIANLVLNGSRPSKIAFKQKHVIYNGGINLVLMGPHDPTLKNAPRRLYITYARTHYSKFFLCKTQTKLASMELSGILVLCVSISLLLPSKAEELPLSPCDYPAVYNFGDSNSDTGGISAAFYPPAPPSGETFFHRPVGRASDGRLIIDFIAEHLGIPYLSPYLDSIGSNYRHGANFATGGATIMQPNESWFENGVSPFPLEIQVEQYTQFNDRTTYFVNQEKKKSSTKRLPKPEVFVKALFTLDIGQNDITAGIRKLSLEEQKAVIPKIVSYYSTQLKNLYEKGARTFWIHNTGPIGCLPVATVKVQDPIPGYLDEHGCVKNQNEIAIQFNKELKDEVLQLRTELYDASLVYVDMYTAKYELIKTAENQGFGDPFQICCGYHGIGYDIWCGKKGTVNGNEVSADSCPDPSVVISWDGVHYSEAANRWIADHIINGSLSDPPIAITRACHKQLLVP
ncbi:hypothetical protein F511_30237 [Dorcoceras hygrometricum]|uniref:GDSL esterase/lipase-like n=1 Tax=Dorcoceras hygrometricum TaxID=472368 RepID=A0A2Z7A1H0_9LAMI|nr:hypothetical protein F511_30237 [Dorcoceras hygrometricum]